MTALYQLAVLGSPTDAQISEVEEVVGTAVGMFNLRLGHEVGWEVRPEAFNPDQQRSSAAVFFGGENPPLANVAKLLERGIPLLPIASDVNRVSEEIPELLRPLNCLAYTANGPQRVATALLECAGLLPRQRRVFVSYRRGEARDAALQLFDALSARLFDVFLDTHGIPPAEDFQTMLWHRLCDSDVLVMLDTPGYFESRWTSAEFGRALAKGISVLRVGWPDCTPSARTATASRAELLPEEVDAATGRLADSAVERICLQLEEVRSQSHAVRSVNLVSNLRNAIQTIGGQLVGVDRTRRSISDYRMAGMSSSTQQLVSPRRPRCMTHPPIRQINRLPSFTIMLACIPDGWGIWTGWASISTLRGGSKPARLGGNLRTGRSES